MFTPTDLSRLSGIGRCLDFFSLLLFRGLGLSLFSGIFYGLNFVPSIYIQDQHTIPSSKYYQSSQNCKYFCISSMNKDFAICCCTLSVPGGWFYMTLTYCFLYLERLFRGGDVAQWVISAPALKNPVPCCRRGLEPIKVLVRNLFPRDNFLQSLQGVRTPPCPYIHTIQTPSSQINPQSLENKEYAHVGEIKLVA